MNQKSWCVCVWGGGGLGQKPVFLLWTIGEMPPPPLRRIAPPPPPTPIKRKKEILRRICRFFLIWENFQKKLQIPHKLYFYFYLENPKPNKRKKEKLRVICTFFEKYVKIFKKTTNPTQNVFI